jgi:glyceraldehyde-3-phosphate dehydrogenase (NAD(P))
MIKVGVNGFGTIGRRVADAVAKQKDMELVGITKVHPDYKSKLAEERGLAIYGVDMKAVEAFKGAGYSVKGTLNDLLHRVDVVVDAAPEDTGHAHLPIYKQAGVRSVFEGGAGDGMDVPSFVAQCNFEEAKGKEAVKVVSCNTTALCRVIWAVDKSFGVKKARAVLARRAADPDDVKRGPIDAVVLDPPTLPSHHGPDVQKVLKNLNIVTMAYKVPTTHMHVHTLILSLAKGATSPEVVRVLEKTRRVMTVDGGLGVKSTAAVIDLAREMGRPRNDLWEAVVWKDSVSVVDGEAYMFMAVDQEAIVVPENVDAVRALAGGYTAEESMKATDDSLGIGIR